jgi:hypothetical protein
MRINQGTAILSRQSQSRPMLGKIFIAAEGEQTEICYLSGLVKAKSITNVVLFSPSYSNPKKIYEELVDFSIAQKADWTFSALLFFFFIYFGLSTPTEKLPFLQASSAFLLNNRKKEKDQATNKDSLSYVHALCNQFSPQSSLSTFWDYLRKLDSYNPELDKLYLVADRDRNSFTKGQLDDVMKGCLFHKILFILSNPCIEFYFLLHFSNCSSIPETQLLENKKVGHYTLVYRLLKAFDPAYGKKNVAIGKYLSLYPQAKTNSLNFAHQLNDIQDHPGSNLFELVDLLLSENPSANEKAPR